jgi:gliding motility-associated-like protein
MPGIPIIDAGEDVTIKLAESARLHVVSSVAPDTIIWSALPGLSCYDCPISDASPVQTTTCTVTVTSEDGCIATDSVTVTVLHIRDIYVPNVFSPNSDGLNDAFTVYSGPAVMEVSKFLVFDRWGELVFENHHFQPNDLEIGWDGTFKGEQMKPAVFTWFAEVLFIDGETKKAEGGVSLLR